MKPNRLRYATIFSGIEGCSVALEGMAWEPVFFAEIDKNANAVLAYRFPDVPNLGDVRNIGWNPERKEVTNGTTTIRLDEPLDLLAGGSPCQDLSTAGRRKGLSGERSGLFREYARLVRELRPRFFLWENVGGTFQSNGGEDFKAVLEALAEGGYLLEWAVLSPHLTETDRHPGGIPQRRDRVWLVGSRNARVDSGDGAALPRTVLPFLEGLPGSRDEGGAQTQEVPGGVADGASLAGREDGGGNGERVRLPAIVEADHCRVLPIARTIVGGHDGNVGDTTNLLAQAFADTFNGTITGGDAVPLTSRTGLPDATGPKVVAVNIHNVTIAGDVAPTVTTETGGGGRTGPKVLAVSTLDQKVSENSQTLSGCHGSCDHTGAVWQNATIRRITPFEAERLMGFRDGWTLVPVRKWRRSSAVDREHILSHCPEYADAKFWREKSGKLQTRLLADGPRYMLLGNSWATNCARWVLQCIDRAARAGENEEGGKTE